MPVGHVMFKMQDQGLPVWSPVLLDVDDPPVILEIKALMSTMLSCQPEGRPTADKTKEKLKYMLGEYSFKVDVVIGVIGVIVCLYSALFDHRKTLLSAQYLQLHLKLVGILKPG